MGDLVITSAREAELHELLAEALELGKGVLHLLTHWTVWSSDGGE